MDKVAANNFIVVLKREIKKAKAMVAGNIVRKIKDLKKPLEEESDGQPVDKDKIDAKISKLHADIKLLKNIDSYAICKGAILKSDAKYWKNLISNPKTKSEDSLMARVICKGAVQKQVAQFRSDHPDCDEWLEEYFEFREKKRELIENTLKVGKNRPQRPDFKPQKNQKQLKDHKNFTPKKKPSAGPLDNPISKRNSPKSEQLHPSWASKRREKELLKKALSQGIATISDQQQPTKHLVLNAE